MKIRHEHGAALVEYAMLVGLISVVSIGAVLHLGGEVRGVFSTTTSEIADANQTASAGSQETVAPSEPSTPVKEPTGTAASTFTITSGVDTDSSGNAIKGYSFYYSGIGSMDDYTGPFPSIQQLTFNDHDLYPAFLFRVSGDFVDALPGHTLSCSDNLILAFDDGYNLSYDSSGDRTSISWSPGSNPNAFLQEGVQIVCYISNS